MQTIQVVIDSKLLAAADRAARRSKLNRSALIRQALREHLHRAAIRDKETADQEGYNRSVGNSDDAAVWEAEAAWPID